MNRRRTVAYVEFSSDGHRASHVRAVVEAFRRLDSQWYLVIWVSRRFLSDHADLCSMLQTESETQPQIVFKCFEDLAVNSSGGTPFSQFETICHCIRADNADGCFIASLDSCLKEISFSRPGKCPARLSGILFRPSLHYRIFPMHGKSRQKPSVWKWLKRYALTFMVCHRPIISEILTHDPMAPAYYNRKLGTSKFRYLPVFVDRQMSYRHPRRHFRLPEGRTVFSFVGSIAARKGVREFLEAMRIAFEENPRFRHQTAFVFAGEVVSDVRKNVYLRVSELVKSYPEAFITLRDRFMTDRQFVTLIAASDIICIPYIRFVGMSGLLVHAAAYGKPVLGPEFGLVGELIRRNGLGITCDASNPSALAKGLYASLKMHQQMSRERRESIKAFAAGRPLEQLGEEICASMVRIAKKN